MIEKTNVCRNTGAYALFTAKEKASVLSESEVKRFNEMDTVLHLKQYNNKYIFMDKTGDCIEYLNVYIVGVCTNGKINVYYSQEEVCAKIVL